MTDEEEQMMLIESRIYNSIKLIIQFVQPRKWYGAISAKSRYKQWHEFKDKRARARAREL